MQVPEIHYKNFSKSKLILRFVIFSLLLVWCLGIISNVIISNQAVSAITYPILKKFYGTVCHQIEAKTFSISGHNFFVCARCTGIYFGALIISIISLFYYPKINLSRKLIYLALFPMALDVFFAWINLYRYIKFLAFGTGIFFGSIVFIYILAALENYFITNKV